MIITAKEQALFDSIATKYCRKDLIPSMRIARKHRLRRTTHMVPKNDSNAILEIGCGAGFAASYLRGEFGSYCGIDVSSKLVELAEKFNSGSNIRFLPVPLEDYQPEREFDLVFAIGVLHHLDDPVETTRRMTSFTKRGGWVVVNEPQPANPLIRAARRCRKRLDSKYSDDQRELSAPELREMFQQAGLERVQIVPQGLLSTPLAEIVLRPAAIVRLVAVAACIADAALERAVPALMRHLSWNLIACGQKP